MKPASFLLVILATCLFLLCGCGTRSISNAGYGDGQRGSSPFYLGELSEYDVLGIENNDTASDQRIAKELNTWKKPFLPLGKAIMVVQSGAMIPDADMLDALNLYYDVAVYSGVPNTSPMQNYSNALRLAAARAGCDAILMYWGVLESAQTSHASKAISWVPIIGDAIPDESQEMRIRLKVALIDTKTGHWDSFVPETFEDTSSSSRHSRKSVDQKQVDLLKTKAYRTAVNEIVNRYALMVRR